MSSSIKKLAENKWFVPIVIFILVLIALSSFTESKSENNSLNLTTEKQLEEMCNAIVGVKNAKVMITYETVAAASMFESQTHTNKIQGVAIICEGGNDPNVQLKLHNMVKALFGISSTQITVSERNTVLMS